MAARPGFDGAARLEHLDGFGDLDTPHEGSAVLLPNHQPLLLELGEYGPNDAAIGAEESAKIRLDQMLVGQVVALRYCGAQLRGRITGFVHSRQGGFLLRCHRLSLFPVAAGDDAAKRLAADYSGWRA